MARRAMDSDNDNNNYLTTQYRLKNQGNYRNLPASEHVTCRFFQRTTKMSVHLCFILLIFQWMLGEAAGTGVNSSSNSAPLDIYLHKLSLMLSPTPTPKIDAPIFDDIVNATKQDLNINKNSEGFSLPASIDSTSLASSLEFKCQGLDCPTAEHFRSSSGSSEFHPTVLPKWKTLQRNVEENEGRQNISSPLIVKKKLGPLRVFKYVHHPEDMRIATITTSTTNAPVPKPAFINKHSSKAREDNLLESMESERIEDRALIPNSFFEHTNKVSGNEKSRDSTSYKSKGNANQNGKTNGNTNQNGKTHGNTNQNGKANGNTNQSGKTNGHAKGELWDNGNTSGKISVGSLGKEDAKKTNNVGKSATSASKNVKKEVKKTEKMEKSQVKTNANETKDLTMVNATLDDAFRSRRSPFRPHWRDHKLYTNSRSREALYQMYPPTMHVHPPPPGFASIPLSMPRTSQSNPMVKHALVPVSPPVIRPSSQIPMPNQMGNTMMNAMQYNPMPTASDRNYIRAIATDNGPDAESPEEQGTFRMNSFKHPPKNRGPRRPPPRSGKRPPGSGGPVPSVMPPPKPIPVPIPVPVQGGRGRPPQRHHHHPHHHHHHPRGSHPSVYKHRPPPPPPNPQPLRAPPSVQYSYPKDAANIQDILTYFKTEENEIPGNFFKNSQGSNAIPALTGGGGISSEFRDVHTSLLKDIQSFAQRPTMMSPKDNSRESMGGFGPPPGDGNKEAPSVLPLLGPEDPFDDILDPKPKPVRKQHRPSSQDKVNSGERSPPSRPTYSDDADDDENNYENTNNNAAKRKGPKEDRHRSHRYPDDDDDADNDYDYDRRKENKRHRPHRSKGHKDEDNFDERPYANNLHSDTYTHDREREAERDRHRDYGLDHHYSTKSRRPTKSTRNRSKSHRNKSKSKSQDYYHEKSRHREREALGSRERERIHQAPAIIHRAQPQKIIPLSHMDQVYYQQRNRPVVIKRPYSPYRPVDVKKLEQQRKHHDKYWNTVDVIKVVDTKPTMSSIGSPSFSRPSTLPQPHQTHYHYYGIGGSPGPTMSRVPASTTRRPVRVNPHDMNGSLEGDVVEIHHTGVAMPEISSTPIYTSGTYSSGPYPVSNGPYPTTSSFPVEDANKKAHLHKMYMDYLQRKLEAQAEAQAEAMLNQPIPPPPTQPPTTPKPKRPMRMKIHIYPNEKVQVVDHSNPNPQTVYYSNPNPTYGPPPSNPYAGSPVNLHRSYGHYEHSLASSPTMMPPVVMSQAPPPHPMSTLHHNNRGHARQNQPARPHPSTNGGQAGDKNKNLVLHLHVHRRSDNLDASGMEMAGSEAITSTVKPLTYDEIYAEGTNDHMEVAEDAQESQQVNREEGHEDADEDKHARGGMISENDKSLSVELPIHQDKIDDVLSTLLKLRE